MKELLKIKKLKKLMISRLKKIRKLAKKIRQMLRKLIKKMIRKMLRNKKDLVVEEISLILEQLMKIQYMLEI